MKRLRRSCGDEQGTSSLELAMLGSLLLVGVLLVSFGWRVTQAAGDVADAAAEAARAASLGSVSSIDEAARSSATESLSAGGLLCQQLDVATSLTRLGEFEAVEVEVTCTVDLRDLALVGVPGKQAVSARHVAVIDRFRGGS